MFAETNWLAVIVASLAPMVIGMIWYNPKVFGTAWMKGAGITPDATKKGNMALIFGLSFLMLVVISSFLSTWVHEDENLPEFWHGAFHGFMLSIFIAVPFIVINALYEMKNWQYMVINSLYAVVSMCVEAGILFCWPN